MSIHRPACAVVAAALLAAVPATAQETHDHGDGHGMYVLPGPSTTTDAQRAYARHLLARAKAQGRRWATRRMARRDGYRPIGSRPDATKSTFHYNNPARYHDGRRLDPRHPESLVYRQVAPHRYRLVALMFRAPATARLPHPAGALLRWHVHYACEPDDAAMAADGPCTHGMHMRTGPTAMAHVWFTHDLDHAFGLMRPSDDLLEPTPVH